jgi:hypothetical protein
LQITEEALERFAVIESPFESEAGAKIVSA